MDEPLPQVSKGSTTQIIIGIGLLVLLALFCVVPKSCSSNDGVGEVKTKGLFSAKQAARYLGDLRDMTRDGSQIDSSEFDKKWKWAWQEIAEAEKLDFDKEITDKAQMFARGFCNIYF